MDKLKDYTITQPKDVPDKPGVFAIARYINKESTSFEILYCAESENIKLDAKKTMSEKKFDGFDRSIIYLISLEPDPKRRKVLLEKLKDNCK